MGCFRSLLHIQVKSSNRKSFDGSCNSLFNIHSTALSIPPYINPLILYILMALFLLNPTRTFRHEARFWTLKILGRIVCAPFCYVNFADFWIADQLNSIVPAFLDLQYFFCFYTTNTDFHKVESKIRSLILKPFSFPVLSPAKLESFSLEFSFDFNLKSPLHQQIRSNVTTRLLAGLW